MDLMRFRFSFVALIFVAGVPRARSADIPSNLVVDVHVFEARSASPDYQAMDALSFFIDTDGTDVSEQQWLATVARKVPDSYLATLARQTLSVDGDTARLVLGKRSRSFDVEIDLSGFLPKGTYGAQIRGELQRNGETQRSFEHTIELRTGQTFVWSDRGLELSASEYLSHFRDYLDRDHRRLVYERLRDFGVSLILTVTPRLQASPEVPAPVTLSLPPDVELPSFDSPWDVALVGTVELALDIGADGMPTDVVIVRSSLPEVNPRLLGEARHWRFPDAAGKTGRLVLELRAEPR